VRRTQLCDTGTLYGGTTWTEGYPGSDWTLPRTATGGSGSGRPPRTAVAAPAMEPDDNTQPTGAKVERAMAMLDSMTVRQLRLMHAELERRLRVIERGR
jgi:hypothetical protein